MSEWVRAEFRSFTCCISAFFGFLVLVFWFMVCVCLSYEFFSWCLCVLNFFGFFIFCFWYGTLRWYSLVVCFFVLLLLRKIFNFIVVCSSFCTFALAFHENESMKLHILDLVVHENESTKLDILLSFFMKMTVRNFIYQP